MCMMDAIENVCQKAPITIQIRIDPMAFMPCMGQLGSTSIVDREHDYGLLDKLSDKMGKSCPLTDKPEKEDEEESE